MALIDDVLLVILTFCDISTVLAASQASRHLHALAFSKEVWSALVGDLWRRSFLDFSLGACLDDSSTGGFVDLVKRIVHGPSSWSANKVSSKRGPTVARQILLKPPGPGILTWPNQAQLLPGGAFVFYENRGKLECWNVETKKLIWTSAQEVMRWVEKFSVESTADGQAAFVLIGIHDYSNGQAIYSVVELLRLDLNTGNSKRLLEERVPVTVFDDSFSLLRVQGDYAIADFYGSGGEPKEVILFKLSTGTTRTFVVQQDEYDVDLVSGNLVMVSRDPKAPHKLLEIRLWRMANLFQMSNKWALMDSIAPQISTSIKLAKPCRRLRLRLAAHPSPLHSDESRIWMLALSSSPKLTIIRKYKVSHTGAEPLSMRCTKSYDAKNIVQSAYYDWSRISYAGYAHTYNKMLSLSNPRKLEVEFPPLSRTDYAHLSAYSGALTYATDENVVVNYYE